MLLDKAQLLDACMAHIAEQRASLEEQLKQLRTSQGSDTKSSAGDKHETGREMIAQEIGKIEGSLANLHKTQHDLGRVNMTRSSATVTAGSFVVTDTLHLFIAAALGKVQIGDTEVMVISTAAPLSKVFLGKQANEQVEFNGIQHHIKSIH